MSAGPVAGGGNPRCPHCGSERDMTDCENLQGHVSYWGENPAIEVECGRCDVSYFIKEYVTRTWDVGRTSDEAEDILAPRDFRYRLASRPENTP